MRSGSSKKRKTFRLDFFLVLESFVDGTVLSNTDVKKMSCRRSLREKLLKCLGALHLKQYIKVTMHVAAAVALFVPGGVKLLQQQLP